MKKVDVSFVHVHDPKRKSGAVVIVEDDVDNYDIHTYFEKALELGWVISSIECVSHNVRIEQLFPREY